MAKAKKSTNSSTKSIEQVTLEVTPEVTLEVTPEVTLEVTPEVTLEVKSVENGDKNVRDNILNVIKKYEKEYRLFNLVKKSSINNLFRELKETL